MTGWVSTNVIGEGYINGSMDFDSTGFFPVFAAPNPDEQEWHGPAMKHSLSETVQDLKLIWVFGSMLKVAGVPLDGLKCMG